MASTYLIIGERYILLAPPYFGTPAPTGASKLPIQYDRKRRRYVTKQHVRRLKQTLQVFPEERALQHKGL